MTGRALVGLFVRDLVRRRLLWVLTSIFAGVLAFNYYVTNQQQTLIEQGATPEQTTAAIAAAFEAVTRLLAAIVLPFATSLAVLVAPESRRSGATQFLLSVPVSRGRVAASQYGAVALLLAGVVAIMHVGLGYPAWRAGVMSGFELLVSWAPLLAVVLIQAAMVVALSTALSTSVTLITVLLVPFLLWLGTRVLISLGGVDATLVIRLCEHAQFVFPHLGNALVWPRPFPVYDTGAVPRASALLSVAHEVASVSFWILLGLFLYRRSDVGTRTLLR